MLSPFRILWWPVEAGSLFSFPNLVFKRPLLLREEHCLFGESFDLIHHGKFLTAHNAPGRKLWELGLLVRCQLLASRRALPAAKARSDCLGQFRRSSFHLLLGCGSRNCARGLGNALAVTSLEPHPNRHRRNAHPGEHPGPPNLRPAWRGRQVCQHPFRKSRAWLDIAIVR